MYFVKEIDCFSLQTCYNYSVLQAITKRILLCHHGVNTPDGDAGVFVTFIPLHCSEKVQNLRRSYFAEEVKLTDKPL